MAVTVDGLIVGVQNFTSNPYDVIIPAPTLEQFTVVDRVSGSAADTGKPDHRARLGQTKE